MKVTLNWLKQYVDFNWSPEELAERLTMLGIEVEGVQKLGGEFEGIVVAQILTSDKASRTPTNFRVCRVNDGKGERQIVCGAKNFKAGDKVPLILPGARCPLKPGETTVHNQGRQNPRRRIPGHDVFAAGTGLAGSEWMAC